MTMQLAGKKIIVTGAAQGMGASTVRAYAAEGAEVAAVDVKDDLGRRVAEEATLQGPGKVTYHHANVTDRAEVDAAFSAAVVDLGGLDVLVNIAGVQRARPAAEFTDEDLDFVLGINLRGTILTNQAAYRTMREAGSGVVLNFGSDAGLTAMPGLGAYAASKGGVMAWTRTIAGEWGPEGIRANSVVPAVQTPMTANGAQERGNIYSSIPLGGRLGDPERDFAPVMVFLASDGARFITGQIIAVNGGLGMVR
ncbi:SDR family NAD(P)-dependent oxidoreductase [Streptomyces sp. NPDC088746]|uniref:SDR family NAD(P)-dependent oxidoreductase n=1 Tax=Streptomyces sp. NPDC088746 TaxID=3365885 RepID=UPI003823E03E